MVGLKITREQIELAQAIWAEGIVQIGRLSQSGGDYKAFARQFIADNYAYADGVVVQFKPTKASDQPYRATFEGGLSYFVGGDSRFSEDQGFALMPWSKIIFDNHHFFVRHDLATVMGRYLFYDTGGKAVPVDFTFGYLRVSSGELKIFLHHSSLPYLA